MDEKPQEPNRRDFLIGRALQSQFDIAGEILAGALEEPSTDPGIPACGPVLRLGKQAMACDFEVILNPGPSNRLAAASAALDLIDLLEDQLSIYRECSEVSRLNTFANSDWFAVESGLYELLRLADRISYETAGAYDITSNPLIALWRECKRLHRLPLADELSTELARVGMKYIEWDDDRLAVRFLRSPMSINLGSIGKGYALDRVAHLLEQENLEEFLIHGGKSSLLARGSHNGLDGWPIGILNPMFPERNLFSLILRNEGLSTSGSNIQYFRLGGRRFGHILDPRTGWPAEQLASATVVAPTAALAEALSTAFFVIGVEKARQYCHNHQLVKAILILPPQPGQKLKCVNLGFDQSQVIWTSEAEFDLI